MPRSNRCKLKVESCRFATPPTCNLQLPLAPLLLLALLFASLTTSRADDFDLLRVKWFNMLTFGTNATKSDTNYYAWITNIESNAQSYSSTMSNMPTRQYLWKTYNNLGSMSGDIAGTYSRLR